MICRDGLLMSFCVCLVPFQQREAEEMKAMKKQMAGMQPNQYNIGYNNGFNPLGSPMGMMYTGKIDNTAVRTYY